MKKRKPRISVIWSELEGEWTFILRSGNPPEGFSMFNIGSENEPKYTETVYWKTYYNNNWKLIRCQDQYWEDHQQYYQTQLKRRKDKQMNNESSIQFIK